MKNEEEAIQHEAWHQCWDDHGGLIWSVNRKRLPGSDLKAIQPGATLGLVDVCSTSQVSHCSRLIHHNVRQWDQWRGWFRESMTHVVPKIWNCDKRIVPSKAHVNGRPRLAGRRKADACADARRSLRGRTRGLSVKGQQPECSARFPRAGEWVVQHASYVTEVWGYKAGCSSIYRGIQGLAWYSLCMLGLGLIHALVWCLSV